ncbi:3-deoxy-7-phosphoheptulonate synthase [Candidatus Carsonella ruddii]|uniref:3-deoxy-7-phosphoheptulonate synthase n=1 Tax=Candidatus Carsonella ruddii (Diaphorina cf. continua) TaxID=2661587 RepID=A0A7R6VZB3_CARRU|nr:3-deoxy-7-phosphoheptulonate synthase [Candidatus Carsonella ruddii (Diaphorina cf. continua)]BCG49331.1 3-deoxy-7-phosphoheptulonate synthase [Candidatus Carsonella ruddii (Diaphorina cf. continua)]
MFRIINFKRLLIDLKNKIINIKKLKQIIFFKKKIILILGPCSLSNIKEFLEYAKKIKTICFNIEFFIRVYYEKPRTNIGWKGYIYDPYIDNSYCMYDSIFIIRRLLIDLTYLNINIATECLNFYLINYFLDCISWICIGARTSNSQIHREFCSSIKNIIGIKNEISGKLSSLKDSLQSICANHCFPSFFEKNKIIFTKGNKYCQYVLRGGTEPNFQYLNIKNFSNYSIIDCSHSNSMKNPINQIYVLENVYNQYKYLNVKISGFMLESYDKYGNQDIKNKVKNLSITDSCINFSLLNTVVKLLNEINS